MIGVVVVEELGIGLISMLFFLNVRIEFLELSLVLGVMGFVLMMMGYNVEKRR